MGVTAELFVSPEPGKLLTHSQFTDFVMDLAAEKITKYPFTAMEGNLPDYPYELWSYACTEMDDYNTEVRSYGEIRVIAQGKNDSMLKQALHNLEYDEMDCCVWFNHFNFENPDLRSSFRAQGFSNASVAICSFRLPRQVLVFDAYGTQAEHHIQLAQFLYADAKGGPSDIKETPLEPIVHKHFGENIVVDCAWG